jgi:hypothetical protein
MMLVHCQEGVATSVLDTIVPHCRTCSVTKTATSVEPLHLFVRTTINLHRTFISPVAARGARSQCMRSSVVIYCLLLSS